MQTWGVGRQIYVGFGSVLALLAVLASVSFFATSQLSTIFTDYRTTARQTLLVSDFVKDLFEARMAALKFRISPSEEAAAALNGNIDEITAGKGRVDELFGSEATYKTAFSQLKSETEQYRDAFKEMRALQAKREEAVSKLVELGPKARKQLTSIMETAYRDGDPAAAYYAGLAQQELMLGRFYTERFLLTNDEGAFAKASDHFRQANDGLVTLLGKLQNSERRRNAEATIADIEAFRETSNALWPVITERNAIRSDKLDVLGPKMQGEYEQVLEAIVDRQNILGPEGAAIADSTLWLVAGLAIGAFGIGTVFALMIARSVTGSVRRMADNMDALANDDLDVEIRGAEQTHELGLMAKALNVFKENALKVRQMAKDKEEADAAAVEARQRMMAELQASFGAVVDGAVAGDFSGRVSAEFPDQELNELADGVNRLLETVNSGVGETGRVLARIAKGDLKDRMSGEFHGAFAELQRNVNETVERLSGLVGDIAATTQTVSRGATEITSGAEDLAARAEQQASSLEETAATMEEMSASIKSNADSSATASTLAADASDRADAGGEIVKSAVSAMNAIEEGAAQIADIISVIDGIAFQTNLLALNAAVEAARAGDAGKGFAVVASEVRALAQRSSDASRDIRHLIEKSAGQVSEGVKLVTETGASLEGIVASIAQVEEAIKNIAAASVEQSSGVEEISSAVSHMDQMTQQNSSMAEQSASNARALTEGAKNLQELIAFFKIDVASKEASDDADWRSVETAKYEDRLPEAQAKASSGAWSDF